MARICSAVGSFGPRHQQVLDALRRLTEARDDSDLALSAFATETVRDAAAQRIREMTGAPTTARQLELRRLGAANVRVVIFDDSNAAFRVPS